jgi:D-lactate dehydrogenase (cytochrome)
MNSVGPRSPFDGIADLSATTDPEACAILSADIAGPASHPAAMVLRPATEAALVAAVIAARREGVALHPRGGGWSYTGGYAPSARPSALVDTSGLQGIAIDRDANAVTVGSGTTWAQLYDALDAAGLRAPSFGPLSGLGATLGGGAAQNGGFFGAAGHGAFGDGAIIGGTLITGLGEPHHLAADERTDGIIAPQPLVGDCGAFGIRSAVVLRTVARPATTLFASFHFRDGGAALAVLAGLPGLPCLGEAYVFDPGTHANLARTGFSVIESAGLAGDLLSGAGGLLGRVAGLVRTVRAGKAFVADLAWSLHVSLDGDAGEAKATLAEITRRALAAGAEIIPDVIPRVTRARPFRRIKALLGPDGEAWLPLHGVFTPDRAQAALAAAQAVLAEHAAEMAALRVRVVILAVLMGTRVIVEPQLFWPDALGVAVAPMATAEQRAAYADRPADLPARRLAHALRRRLTDALDQAGATHFQIGRGYAAHPGVPDAARSAWAALKQQFDPDGIMNPGVLGL